MSQIKTGGFKGPFFNILKKHGEVRIKTNEAIFQETGTVEEVKKRVFFNDKGILLNNNYFIPYNQIVYLEKPQDIKKPNRNGNQDYEPDESAYCKIKGSGFIG